VPGGVDLGDAVEGHEVGGDNSGHSRTFSGVNELAEAIGAVIGYFYQLRPAGRAGDEHHLGRPPTERLRERPQGRFGGASVDGGCLDSHDQGVVAVAPAHPGSSGPGLHPDLRPDGYTLRSTATTLPMIEAFVPSMGS